MKKLLTLLVLFLGLGIANAQTQDNGQKEVDAGLEAGKDKNYTLAMDQFKIAAEKGNSDGDNYIGALYYNGLGVEKNVKESIKWWEKASAKNNTDAMNNLGVIYTSNEKLKNIPIAISWYKKAAVLENSIAMAELGMIYYFGEDDVKDKAEAYKWFRKAADKKNYGAYLMISEMYFSDEVSIAPSKEEFLYFFKEHIVSKFLIGLLSGDKIEILSVDECQIKLYLTISYSGAVYELVLPTKINGISPAGFITYKEEIATRELKQADFDTKEINKVEKLKEINQLNLNTEIYDAEYFEKVFRFASSLCKK